MKTLFILAALGLTACGAHPDHAIDCIDGCNGENKRYNPETDNTPTVITGPRGVPGASGQNGSSCTTYPVEGGAVISCTDGTETFVGNGTNGQDGQDGQDGEAGQAGESCSVARAENGAIISCGTETVVVYDGIDGQDGENGIDGNDAVVEIIDPCGDNPGKFDEVLLRLPSGELLAYFEDGDKRFLSLIGAGNYRTTDKQACNFSVDSDLNVSWN